ncbi:MAG: hypothetical protein OXU94_03640 [Gammaproteobacteria bacterium]|nr:hypothetical protein [Gammaproteobacteria bacterium]
MRALTITAQQIGEALTPALLMDSIAEMHRAPHALLDENLLGAPAAGGEESHLLVRSAWQPPHALGVKLARVFPGNVRRGLPSITADYLLFSGADGRLLAAVDGIALTCWKTAADSGLGARFLARKNVRTMLMVGAGAMAPHLVRAHRSARPSIKKILLWNRTMARAAQLAETLAAETAGAEIEVRDDLAQAVGEAGLISCATMAPAPLIKGAWLAPGAHLDLVGAFTPHMREADDGCLRLGSLFVDSRKTTSHIGEIKIPLAAGVIQPADICAELAELCNGEHPGRRTEEEITVYKNGGGGHLDLMTARAIYRRLSAPPHKNC